MTFSTFSALGLAEPLQRALAAAQFTTPTPIQAKAIPAILSGRDVLGLAQTGTGKTAAFGLPLLHRLFEEPIRPASRAARALILAPTRELAVQIDENLRNYGRHLKLRHAVILGGINQNKQIAAMRNGVDILVATPGRLLDLAAQGHAVLSATGTLIIDEADRMFDMGFIGDVRRIVSALPRKRHAMLFSATMPAELTRFVSEFLRDPVRISVSPPTLTADRIEQKVYFVQTPDKRTLLDQLLHDPEMARVIVFTRTKHGANKVAQALEKAGHTAEAIHGNKSQGARQRALEQFRAGRARVLVATDIAARGIDIDDVTHVVNFELPDVAESYVHRIGRTARAGSGGIAISFCDSSENRALGGIERLIGKALTVAGGKRQPANARMPAKPATRRRRRGRQAMRQSA